MHLEGKVVNLAQNDNFSLSKKDALLKRIQNALNASFFSDRIALKKNLD